MLLQLCEGALENLTSTALVGEPRLDPAQGLGARMLLLLELLEAVIEVPCWNGSIAGSLAGLI